ncbi:precorrin-2 dehydrogenase/sirohydrochlorin ferrochelatase family protein [Vibrio genomosp. F10]|uniref:precorrin-2 dehydrogenase/sirohydrochlorin ferrochelatase family protein n=1 Tax=Vibrio genomosp. F10 TaxID=723171 RepID=UPI0002FDF3C4|nr:bifunctional precorrin-2 dehydrogenase/sirohydrochlorin ferrochelatase [Vibrio genomosp. F10]OEF05832.1 ferrochelatase [Vibrio genomosp. F10 str. 9ZD137]
MQYFPLFMDLNNKPVLVVGGGEVACRKVDSLLRAGALVTITSPKIDDYLQALVTDKKCQWFQHFYSSDCIRKEYVQVWATTDNPELNHQVHKDAKRQGIMVNVVDDLPYCDFITPSMVNRGRIQIAISSGGASPVLIRNIRETLETVLPHNLALVADFAASKRNSIKEYLPTVDQRRKFWELFLNSSTVNEAKTREQLEHHYNEQLESGTKDNGFCFWICYGDDVEMLTLKAMRYMQQSELVLHHQDCPFDFIDLSRRDAERISFKSPIDLADELQAAREQGKRVCVFISDNSHEYALLMKNDPFLLPGSAKSC